MPTAHVPADRLPSLPPHVRVDRRTPGGAWVTWPDAVIPPAPLLGRASAEQVAARRATCSACPHWRPGWTCGVLADRGKGASIMGPRGVPAAAARCPDGRWGPR